MAHRTKARRGEPAALFERLVIVETDDCVLWPFARTDKGYGQLVLSGAKVGVHVLACQYEHGPCPPGMEAAHSCGTRNCFNRRHLRWKTHADNLRDRVKDGTSNRGVRQWQAVLTPADVREIRRMYAQGGVYQRELAARFGVTREAVARILQGRNWAWLD